jgi:hypothetical protein
VVVRVARSGDLLFYELLVGVNILIEKSLNPVNQLERFLRMVKIHKILLFAKASLSGSIH